MRIGGDRWRNWVGSQSRAIEAQPMSGQLVDLPPPRTTMAGWRRWLRGLISAVWRCTWLGLSVLGAGLVSGLTSGFVTQRVDWRVRFDRSDRIGIVVALAHGSSP